MPWSSSLHPLTAYQDGIFILSLSKKGWDLQGGSGICPGLCSLLDHVALAAAVGEGRALRGNIRRACRAPVAAVLTYASGRSVFRLHSRRDIQGLFGSVWLLP
ncbi:hypothetical protein BRADI_3g54409v3 [Brachypodium distachyon]|uniref:Uncharacterized protein n=1 Tax=Brachypodium distachyon TaxID=15368 RepID=A0A2K2D532_BRADI|nr:hypothetical protein BRADI_3g54409v3 [Brachypodium distachyon]